MVDIQGPKPKSQPGSTPPASTNLKTLDSQRVKGFSFVYQRFPLVTMPTAADTPHPEKDKKTPKRHTKGTRPTPQKQKD